MPTQDAVMDVVPVADPAAPVRGHIPALDGLRGLAVVGVMLFHFAFHAGSAHALAALPWRFTDCGWAGVDLFFVLSGFLITGILLDAKAKPRYFRNFYARRTLRIFPLYYGVLILYLVIWPVLFRKPMVPLGQQIWLWCYGTNFSHFWTHSRHLVAGPFLVDHFWSLCVEEHFYLVWPMVVLVCSQRTLMKVCGVLMVSALALRMVFIHLAIRHHSAEGLFDEYAYSLTPCRTDALAIGALLAALAREPGGLGRWVSLARGTFWAGSAALVGIVLWRGTLYQWDRKILSIGLSGLAVYFAALLVLAIHASPASLGCRFLCGKILGTLGKYSYALYVFHFTVNGLLTGWLPVDRLARFFHNGTLGLLAHIVLSSAATFGAAFLSWHLWEKHFLAMKRYFSSGAGGTK